MAITATDVNKLRQMTGVGMMDCKNALTECEGDFEKAIDYLRQRGQKMASKRADREANEGVVLSKTTGNFGAILLLSSETDFVAKNQDFINVAQSILDTAIAAKAKTKEEVLALDLNGTKIETIILDQVAKIGEKIELSVYDWIEADSVCAYIHQGNRLATLAGLSKVGFEEVGKDIAMQIAAMAPISLDKNSIPADIIDREMEVYRGQIREEGKPENMVEQIAAGKLNKFFKESTLLSQEFIKDSKKTVSEYLKSINPELTVVVFKRVALGA